jgi:aryl-alcohol dehydrogenase-like predicted oxidoreductase
VCNYLTLSVNGLAIGTLAWSVTYPEENRKPTVEQCHELIQASLDIRPEGITLFDTADTYSPSGSNSDVEHMETILSEVFYNAKALIATKGGMMRLNAESNSWRPLHSSKSFESENFEDLVQESWKRLAKKKGKDKRIFLYQIHHMDDEKGAGTKLIEVIKVLKKVRDQEGTIQHLGLCNIKGILPFFYFYTTFSSISLFIPPLPTYSLVFIILISFFDLKLLRLHGQLTN